MGGPGTKLDGDSGGSEELTMPDSMFVHIRSRSYMYICS